MQRFTQLYIELDRITLVAEKHDALKRFFLEASSEDAAWALFFLLGHRIPRSVKTADLRQWIADERSLPLWLIEESYDTVGDLSETLALLAPSSDISLGIPFHSIVTDRLLPLKQLSDEEKHSIVTQTWRELTSEECLVYNKLMLGEFRVGISRTLIVHALAEVANIDPVDIEHRIMGPWKPTAEDFVGILQQQSSDIVRPYPFHLVSPLVSPLEELGDVDKWQAEWKWDGVRVQLIKREGQILLWSRNEELITDRFPEIVESSQYLPNGTVLDGEVLAWQVEKPMPIEELQRRVGRKKVDRRIRTEVPVIMMLYDVLEINGEDIRGKSLKDRRRILERLLDSTNEPLPFILSPTINITSWEVLKHEHLGSRERLVDGLILKRKDSQYSIERTKREWLGWKRDPLTIHAVLIYAQQDSGNRVSIFTDYTFGVWGDPDEKGERILVPIAKVHSDLSDEEIQRIDQFVRQNTLDKFGPVRVVKPELVFELAFDGIQRSTRHKAGIVVRSPRITRWREDKQDNEADSLEAMRTLLQSKEHSERGK